MKKKILSVERGIVIYFLLSVIALVFFDDYNEIERYIFPLVAITIIYIVISLLVQEIKKAMKTWKELFKK